MFALVLLQRLRHKCGAMVDCMRAGGSKGAQPPLHDSSLRMGSLWALGGRKTIVAFSCGVVCACLGAAPGVCATGVSQCFAVCKQGGPGGLRPPGMILVLSCTVDSVFY